PTPCSFALLVFVLIARSCSSAIDVRSVRPNASLSCPHGCRSKRVAPGGRRLAPKGAERPQGHLEKPKRFLDRWLNDGEPEPATRVLRTRASDAMPTLNFDEPEQEPQKQPARARELARDDSTTEGVQAVNKKSCLL